MVSQPDPSTLTHRGPSSVVSARYSSLSSRPHTSLRSKRYNRSHAGGGSYVPQNEFPIFSHSGDVEIVIRAGGRENRYLLHRHTLTRCSGFFEASTSRQWSKASFIPASQPLPPLPPPSPPEVSSRELARIGEGYYANANNNSNTGSEDDASELAARHGADSPVPRRRWRYELDPGDGRDDIPMLVQKDASESMQHSSSTSSIFGGGGPASHTTAARRTGGGHSHSHSTGSFFRSVANLSLAPAKSEPPPPPPPLSQEDADLLRDYDNLFRIFYNYPPVLDGVNIADAYVQCKSLLTLADQYDALAVVGPRVDHHLLQFRGRLWRQVAKYPVSYLRLGFLSRSKVIFQEALIHVVGQWPAGERSIRQSLPVSVLDLIEDKVDELAEAVARAEARLFRLSLADARGARVTPASSYLDWLAVSFFRQWLVDNTSPPPPSPPPPLAPSQSHHLSSRRHSSSRAGNNNSSGSNDDDVSSTSFAARASTAIMVASTTAAPNLASLGRTYRILGSGSGGGGYLGHDECKRFLKLTPELYSRENLRRFEKRIDELKGAAREIVRPLMGSGLELETERCGPASAGAVTTTAAGRGVAAGGGGGAMTSYLTCVRVLERDLPWEVED
ncbi:hypothetical protein GGS23DRAFT_114945 [Durotheca rogersii]|uniref:uncharacterized protein n=1 Tax=Durotheca rogersii TaxID=419775 RepID=UPI00221FC479|nr:uncharacterized protein GGS23DRAFT_114945 [Durotheca rogersii]KAI5862256.1 hypothetical protein GGS23DRAFT_114945 [Durotheca rogersii]